MTALLERVDRALRQTVWGYDAAKTLVKLCGVRGVLAMFRDGKIVRDGEFYVWSWADAVHYRKPKQPRRDQP